MSRRLNSCLLIDTTAKAHLPGPQNPGECHLYFAEGCHLYIALTYKKRNNLFSGKFTPFWLKNAAPKLNGKNGQCLCQHLGGIKSPAGFPCCAHAWARLGRRL